MLKTRFWQNILILVAAAIVLIGLVSCSSSGDTNKQAVAKPTSNDIQVTSNTTTTSPGAGVNQPTTAKQVNNDIQATSKPATTSPGAGVNQPTMAKQVSIDVQVTGDTVSIPLNEVKANWNTRFALDTEQGKLTFMAYIWDGKLNIRADICPPCRSKSFTLTKGTLVCDACGTVFDANSGKGIRGACVAYPKESASYQLNGDNIVVGKAGLIKAYTDTLAVN